MAVVTVSGIAHLRVTVSDPQRSIAFHTEVLGFEVMLDGPPPVGDPTTTSPSSTARAG